MYYVISLKHTMKHNNKVCLWRPNNCGYTEYKDRAGLYESPDEYDNEGNMPITEEQAESLFSAQERDSDGNWRMYIPNDRFTKTKLNVRQTRNGLVRLKTKPVLNG